LLERFAFDDFKDWRLIRVAQGHQPKIIIVRKQYLYQDVLCAGMDTQGKFLREFNRFRWLNLLFSKLFDSGSWQHESGQCRSVQKGDHG
jgi:hypothetical protein